MVRSLSLKQIIQSNKFLTVIQVILGLVFVISAIGKIMDLSAFGKVIHSYSVVPDSWVAALALIIPYLELGLGLMLVLNLFPETAGAIGLIMIFSFTTISMYRYFNGDVSDCGCFGKIIQRDNDLTLLSENLVLMTALYFIIHMKSTGKYLKTVKL